ncbi:MAG: hypothetical protein RLZZ319_672 [Actinomycetota bacterium]|jgi:hypothetical protein
MSSAVELAAKALRTALWLGGASSVAIAVIGGVIGNAVSGSTGVISALVGAGVAFVFMGITAASILIGQRLSGGSIASGVFFATVLGAWLLKFALFLVVAFWIKNSGLFDIPVAFGCVIAAVVAAVAGDVVAVSRSRVPVVDMV